MSKLTGLRILNEIEAGHIIINPFDPDYLGPNSYDLTLGPELRIYKGELLDVRKETPTEVLEIDVESGFILLPGTLYLGHTNEVAGSRSYVPCIEGRSSMARLGILVHLTAGFGDVGFISQWTLEIVVIRPVRIFRNTRICQIYFDTLEGTIDRLYEGKYNNSMGAVASKSFKDKEYVDPESYSMKPIPADSNAVPHHMLQWPGPITFGEEERYCSVCGDQQYHIPNGWTCQNGHGGAPEMDMANLPLNTKRICVCGARFVAASNEIGTCWRCGNNNNFEVIDGESK